MTVKVTRAVHDQLEYIRESGETNMFDYTRVLEIAKREGFYDLLDWMVDNKKEYGHGILEGFDVI